LNAFRELQYYFNENSVVHIVMNAFYVVQILAAAYTRVDIEP